MFQLEHSSECSSRNIRLEPGRGKPASRRAPPRTPQPLNRFIICWGSSHARLIEMTDQLRKKLQEEVDALEHELVHELPKEIKRAAALGDLSENAEYHMAKQRQEFVKARFRQLGKRLADLSLTNMNNIPKDKVGLGSTVKVFDSFKN